MMHPLGGRDTALVNGQWSMANQINKTQFSKRGYLPILFVRQTYSSNRLYQILYSYSAIK